MLKTKYKNLIFLKMVDNSTAINYNIDIKIGLAPLLQEDIPMKKIISVLLVALMLFSTVAVSASAIFCNCGKHVESKGKNCHCCVYCPNLEENLIFDCAKREDGSIEACCKDCVGFSTGVKKCKCICDCKYCADLKVFYDPDEDKAPLDGIVSEQEKDDFVSAFQAMLNRISNAFDAFFDVIFSMLGIKTK